MGLSRFELGGTAVAVGQEAGNVYVGESLATAALEVTVTQCLTSSK
jgi:hypothetical protein